ncbi:TPA: type II toxin-antitoxin system RelE/ParE family toxin [Legionella pneumophila subsp. pneumophila]|uniref:Type II toxin-antitoxin system RelE/ParE family toxin n=1 Tax=Legionella pneumophila (strain Lens) TaxID=297245 RepID=Q5WXK3_LEGPL|nr:type II toxin-antitoxin system RelE/ParE family toxin [Legionella pneumophila]AOW52296.1 plasmid maintenance system killer [Legionella pneumophila subsp. pneumophila]AOW54112.1 plasmid maintenance system killer [Legionella pneumophila subsp. pneumophila]AOW57594.1 plasmid maintenance system killer [Legionella pneumophila subsp. pneumophila]AOW62226.1 plasmid maintenance system killer [Legionella pneumophila subsp. pneumophila]AOW63093.1 plasmid maintenance system killer [Legionella pneumoph
MISDFSCKETKKIYDGTVSRKFPQDIQQRARRKLRMLNNAKVLDDLRIPPSNHLEKLVGDRAGQHSIKINDQWRICFVWQDGIVTEVEIVDYH